MELLQGNYLLYAMKHYQNPQCRGIDEFKNDLNHVKYLKRLFRKYYETKDLKTLRIRLVLNHLIVFYNVFRVDAATKILFYKVEPELWSILKTFLVYFRFLPDDYVRNVDGKDIYVPEIPINMDIANELRQI